jgi:hypothetical protein
MKAINTTGWAALATNCTCTGFAPAFTYVYDTLAKTVIVTDASTLPTGDTYGKANINIYDGAGNVLHAQITTLHGHTATVDVSTLDPTKGGLNITATIVTTATCIADLGIYGVNATIATTGSLGYGTTPQLEEQD